VVEQAACPLDEISIDGSKLITASIYREQIPILGMGAPVPKCGMNIRSYILKPIVILLTKSGFQSHRLDVMALTFALDRG
jgi:hypothetical protein